MFTNKNCAGDILCINKNSSILSGKKIMPNSNRYPANNDVMENLPQENCYYRPGKERFEAALFDVVQ